MILVSFIGSSDSLVYSELLLSLFFLQAEDGIRYLIVTGVQTCALPISRVELGHLGSRVADEDVEFPELALHPPHHAGDIVGAAHVGLDDETVGPALLHLGERVLCGRFVLTVVDRDLHPLPGQLERDATADAARASRDQRMLPVVRHEPSLWSHGG